MVGGRWSLVTNLGRYIDPIVSYLSDLYLDADCRSWIVMFLVGSVSVARGPCLDSGLTCTTRLSISVRTPRRAFGLYDDFVSGCRLYGFTALLFIARLRGSSNWALRDMFYAQAVRTSRNHATSTSSDSLHITLPSSCQPATKEVLSEVQARSHHGASLASQHWLSRLNTCPSSRLFDVAT